VLLREGATSMDCLQASFFGHVFLHIIDGGSLSAVSLPLSDSVRAAVPGPSCGSGCSGAGNGSCKTPARCGAAGSRCDSVAPVNRGCPGSASASARGNRREEPGGFKGQGREVGGGDCRADGEAVAGQEARQECWRVAMERSQVVVAALYPDFIAQAECNGWKLQQTMLNPKENRLLRLTPLQA
jgi:hypothetical protein